MDHILQQMQAFSQQCAEILSEIVGIDVSITDNQQMRIAGSGRMKGRVGNIAPMVILLCMHLKHVRQQLY